MILKEAFRMQNHLDNLLRSANMFLIRKENVMNITEEHLRQKSNPSATNETIVVKRDTDYHANDVLDFVTDILVEKEKLSKAISVAKAKADFDIDAALFTNKSKQAVIETLKFLSGLKPFERTNVGTGYLINNDGNQSKYSYDVNTVSTIDYDRNKVKGIFKRIQKETDEVSLKIDALNVTLEVSYEPKYEIGDSFEEALDAFISSDK